MKPLTGLRVVDLADEKGELCGRILADLGAEVIRLEPPEGAVSRTLPPLTPDGEASLYFAFRNAGKRGVVADLESESGRARLDELLDGADILVESSHPGTLSRLGIAAETPRIGTICQRFRVCDLTYWILSAELKTQLELPMLRVKFS